MNLKRPIAKALDLIPGISGVRIRAGLQYHYYKAKHGVRGSRYEHGLPGQLIVSLTSYPPRFPTLHLTLRSLSEQSIKPDRIILWIAESDRTSLPSDIDALENIQIEFVKDVRSFKKLVFAVERYPDSFIATADDDNYYLQDWLELLIRGWSKTAPTITCHRAHRFPSIQSGAIA
ncbi:MAG: hypothetical protein AAGL49_12555, partial [Pseudomonadota bacterium]